MDPFQNDRQIWYCVFFGDRDFVDVPENEYQVGIQMAQRHTEETKICLFDDLEEETEVDVEDSKGERVKDNDETSLYLEFQC
jgi:hypothetical protein